VPEAGESGDDATHVDDPRQQATVNYRLDRKEVGDIGPDPADDFGESDDGP
jgi:hypothetical protein